MLRPLRTCLPIVSRSEPALHHTPDFHAGVNLGGCFAKITEPDGLTAGRQHEFTPDYRGAALMEDETPSGFFPEIVKFLENLPDGVGKTRLCSLLSRGDVADLINLRTAAGSVQGRDINSFVRLVIQKRTAGRGTLRWLSSAGKWCGNATAFNR